MVVTGAIRLTISLAQSVTVSILDRFSMKLVNPMTVKAGW